MLNEIPIRIKERMEFLEKLDQQDRLNGTPKDRRLRQIPRETGKFLSMMLSMSPPGNVMEIGTSAGYSTLWLALPCREQDRKISTFETDEVKITAAKETFLTAGVDDIIEVISGDAIDHLDIINDVSFCFIDCDKEYYPRYYEAVILLLKKGGFLVADNVVSHQKELSNFIDRALHDERVDAMVIPIGKGELLCRIL